VEKFYSSVSPVAILIPRLESRLDEGANQSIPTVAKGAAYCRYEKKIEDYNFGSLIRTDCKDEYSQHNSIFGTSFEPPGTGTSSHVCGYV